MTRKKTTAFLSARFPAKKKILVLCAVLSGAAAALFPLDADTETKRASSEIEALRAAATAPEADAEKRNAAYGRLAVMLRLSGDIEGAAEAWEKAAGAMPAGSVPAGEALLESAASYVSMGEWDKAAVHINTILEAEAAEGDIALRQKARYIEAQIEAFRGVGLAGLVSIAADKDYAAFHAAAYYTLWKVGGAERHRTRLIEGFLDSPEAASALADGKASTRVSAAVSPAPYWLLFPGRESVSMGEVSTAAGAAPASTLTASYVLQTGLFKDKERAEAHAERLGKAGFKAELTSRTVSGANYWAVSVPGEKDANSAILRLKEAGFEAFPVY
jgi:tetratricopeptide (TPR) repeat protein